MPKRKKSAKLIHKNQYRVLMLLGIFVFLFIIFLLRMFLGSNTTTWTDKTVLEGLKSELSIQTSSIKSDSAVWIQSPTELFILKGVSFNGEKELKEGENSMLQETSKTYFYQMAQIHFLRLDQIIRFRFKAKDL